MFKFESLVPVLSVRLLMSVLSQSWYVPDETWQSVEISHGLVFGPGHRTWEWSERIRSSLHPLLFSVPLVLLRSLGLDSQFLVVLAPKLLQGIITGCCEYYLYRVVRQTGRRGIGGKETGGRGVASWFLLITVFNWHSLYTGSRTLINTLEYCLTSLALAFYLLHKEGVGRVSSPGAGCGAHYLPVVALCFMLRPTSALVWAPLVLLHLIQTVRCGRVVELVPWLLVSLVMVLLCILVDSVFYSGFTLSNLNFFNVNVYHNLGVNYGCHPWHWYLSNALPTLLGPLLLPLLQGARHAPLVLLLPLLVNLGILSFLPHKEMRFLQSSFPFLVLIISTQMDKYSDRAQRVYRSIFLAGNLLLALYLSLVHQRGVVDAALWIGKKGSELSKEGGVEVLFLMPCHSTPLYSHIHAHINTRFLHCEPNLERLPDYREEAELFYSNPTLFLEQMYSDPTQGNLHRLPDLVVLFDSLQDQVSSFLERSYKLCQTFFHSHLPEGRVGANVVVFCRT